jgi:RNA polymerase sigma-70 factor (ECF subfamily)
MVAIARNRAIDLVRKKTDVSVEDMPDALELVADVPDPLAARERSEEVGRLLDCLGRLEPEQRQLVLLAYYDGLSREQLAARFKRPVNTIKTWLRRSLLAVRECLGS